ncbi:transporter, major facilitator family protein [Desulfitobacterium hafniense DP7]|uniref:Transporter, major facilitator family protein n=1 Tax=Desulfitobacterium hafniense DP7 TaxID=537010 RepID=G9XJV9_DESHA|nr:OFA family MFS transporter [Desulfitobacterium hafniense]EHL07845.1 transporter, major facilitator family protein [Desulfitobacterium hafniense DP7]
MNKTTRGWTVTFAGTGINLALGVLYTWSVFAAALTEQLAWSKTAASLPYTVACAVFALMMVPGGRLTDRFGPRWVATAGGIFAGGGLILSSLTDSLFVLILTFGLIAGIGIGLGYSAATPAAVKWFPPQKKGLIAGIVVAGFGLASLYIAPLTNSLIASFGVKGAFRIEGLIFLFAIVALSQVLKFPPAPAFHPGPSTPASIPPQAATSLNTPPSPPPAVKGDFSWQEMLKDPRFYLLWVMFAAGATAGLMIIGQLSTITKLQTGISWGFAMVALLAIFNAGGRVLAGWLSDRIGRSWTMRIFFSMQGLNMLAFTFYSSPALIALGAIMTGLSYGSLLSLFPSATYDFFGTKNGGVNYGLIFTAWGVGGVFGPLMAGAVVDLTNSYFYAYLIAAALCLIAAFLTIFLKSSPLEAEKA